MVVWSTTTEHSGMRFKIATWSAGEQAKCHVSEMEIQVNHFVDNGLSDIE